LSKRPMHVSLLRSRVAIGSIARRPPAQRRSPDAQVRLNTRRRLYQVPTCTTCGEQNSERARFCQFCGAPLQAPQRRDSRRTVTVVFTDVVGSTALADRLDTETFTALMDRYFERMSEVADRHGGTVAKFIGDAILIVFGVPATHEDDALRAVRTASEMRRELAVLNEELKQRWDITLATKTAINTGEVLTTTTDLAEDGPARRGGHIAVGDAMNVGARLEQAAEPGEIVLGETTYRLVRDAIEAERMPPLVLKGKPEPATAYRLIGVSSDAEAVARRLDSPMVGRRDDLAALHESFDRARREGGCRVLTILAPAGVGKSRLVKEFLAGVDDEATRLTGHCLSYGEGITFWPLTEMVKHVAGITEQDAEERATKKIAALLDGAKDSRLVARAVGQTVGLATGEGKPEETFWSIRKLFESLARARPLIAVFEDIHWAERTLLDLIESVAEWVRDATILLICTARPELLDTRPDWSSAKRYESTAISLSPLTAEEAERLIRNLVGDDDLGPRRLDAVVEAAGGNPLFMEQVVSMLVEEGTLSHGASVTADVSEIVLPPTIQALIAARLDRLEPDERRVLESASVVGRIFYLEALAELSDDGSGLRPHLMALVRRQLIEPSHSDIAGQEAFRFVHAMVRDAAYQGTPKSRRATLHEGMADWLERAAGERIHEYEEILAYHLEQAHRYRVELRAPDEATQELASRAVGHLSTVAERALARGDAHGAVNLLSRATSVLPSSDRRQPELLRRLSAALGETGALSREREVLEDARDRASASDDRALQARIRLALVMHHAAADPGASVDEVVREADAALLTFGELRDDRGLAAAWRARYWVAHMRYHQGESMEALAHAYEYAQRAREPGAVSDLSSMSAVMLYGPTPVKEAIRRSEAILEQVKGWRSDESFVLGFMGIMHAMDGRPDQGRELIARAGTIAQDLGMRLTSTATRSYWLAILESLSGDHAAAERELRSGYEVLDEMGEKNFASTLAARLAQTLCAMRRYDEAARFVVISREAAAAEDVVSQVISRGAEAKVLAHAGQHREAASVVGEAVELAGGTDALNMQADILVDLAEVQRAAGRRREADETIRRALGLYEQKGNAASAGMCHALLHSTEVLGEPDDRSSAR
jgi:class 3 adenylate cyclase/tetratricopeptide (TPR) repeat protein